MREDVFQDRREAGRRLAAALGRFEAERPAVVALPRGGVPVGYEVARALGVPLDVLMVRKIGVPGHEELALGAVVDGADPQLVVNEEVRREAAPPEGYLERARAEQLEEIARRRRLYIGERLPTPVEGRVVIVVDDGIATGATMRAALRGLRRAGAARLVLAVPVAAAETIRDLAAECDEVVCLKTPEPFHAVGLHYERFDQTGDDEVIELLAAARRHSEMAPDAAGPKGPWPSRHASARSDHPTHVRRSQMAQQPRITLNDGNSIPQLGLGVWQVPPEITARVVLDGIKAGYRSIDTAQGYNNEEGVGEAIRKCGVPRSELFITSKLRNGGHARDLALKSFDETLAKLGLDQLDLFLIHWPVPSQDKYVEAWKVLVEKQKEGRIRSIGVSNFNQDHLERIIGETGVTPAVNQIELHPSFQQRDKRDFHKAHNIAIESWSPLGSGRALGDPTIKAIGDRHGKSVAQTIIRWHLQQGLIVIPKSTHAERIEENFDVFDFELSAEDMATIDGLDNPSGGRIGSNPATASFLF